MAKSKNLYNVIWRPIAETDLNNIVDHIAKDSPARTKRFGNELRDKTQQLAEYPHLA